MIVAALVVAAVLQTQGGPSPSHSGRDGRLEVRPPRVEADITVDGKLDEPAWQRAAVLTGFSQFTPQDGIAAADSTVVRVWYSPTAIYFGIRAYQPPGTVRATLADRGGNAPRRAANPATTEERRQQIAAWKAWRSSRSSFTARQRVYSSSGGTADGSSQGVMAPRKRWRASHPCIRAQSALPRRRSH